MSSNFHAILDARVVHLQHKEFFPNLQQHVTQEHVNNIQLFTTESLNMM